MSFWYNVLQVVTFVLPHVIRLVDDLVKRFNGHLTDNQLSTIPGYQYDVDHITNILMHMPKIKTSEVDRARNLLKIGDLRLGIEVVNQLFCDYQQSILNEPVKQSVMELFMGDSDPDKVTEWSVFTQRVVSILPVAHMTYMLEYKDLGGKIWQLPMSYNDKDIFMKYCAAVSLLESKYPVTHKIGLAIGKNSSWICEKSLIAAKGDAHATANAFYLINDKISNIEGLQYMTLTPRKEYFLYDQLKSLYLDIDENPTVVDVLTARPRYDWVYFDPNVSKQKLVESILMENASSFRILVDRMNSHISRYIPDHRPISDLSETMGMPTFIESARDYIGDGYRYYISRLKMMGLTYALHVSISWSNLKNDRGYSGQSLLYDRDFESRSEPIEVPALAFQNYRRNITQELWGRPSSSIYPRIPTPTYRAGKSE